MFNLFDFYWVVGGDETEVFSSARRAFVPADDAAYLAWIAEGWQPAYIDTLDNLHAILPA